MDGAGTDWSSFWVRSRGISPHLEASRSGEKGNFDGPCKAGITDRSASAGRNDSFNEVGWNGCALRSHGPGRRLHARPEGTAGRPVFVPALGVRAQRGTPPEIQGWARGDRTAWRSVVHTARAH